jgi:hypothetical protein
MIFRVVAILRLVKTSVVLIEYTKVYQRSVTGFNSLTPNDIQRRRAVSALEIKIPSKNMREKPINTLIIY